MKKKVSESIGAKTFLSILTLLILCCVIIYGIVMYFLPKNYQTELESQFVSEFHALVSEIESNGMESSSEDITAFSIRNNSAVQITEESGAEVFSINAREEAVHSSAKEISAVSKVTIANQTYRIFAAASFEAVSQSYDILLKLLPYILITILCISVCGAFICSRHFSKPLIEICSAAKRMSQLDMTWKCDTNRNDEIGVVSRSLNELSERLNHALCELQNANERLQQDIEREKEQEKQRIDFFTSVSHELKTPITIIKGELEGMIYQVGEYKDRETYLVHTLKTVENMEKLVKEILASARMSGSDFQLHLEPLNICNMLTKCYEDIQSIADEKLLNVHFHLPYKYLYHGDRKLLQRAFLNIISNAVFYSPKHAEIDIRLEENTLEIENTGIHIENEDLKQIFLPFFRADKSRSRNTGGSGLGLYLVKMIFDRHGILYHMENTESGVEFTITFENENGLAK